MAQRVSDELVGTREALAQTFGEKRLIYLYVPVGTREALAGT